MRQCCRCSLVVVAYAHPTGKKSKEEAEKAEVEESALQKMVVELEAGRAARTASLTKEGV